MTFATSTLIAGAVAAASAAGSVVQYQGQKKQQKAQRRRESIRRRQMELEASRERRKAIRESTIQRANALAVGGYSGALGSSSIEGAVGSIGNAGAANVQGVDQSLALGQQSFAASASESRGRELASFGGAITSLGGAAVKGFNLYGSLSEN